MALTVRDRTAPSAGRAGVTGWLSGLRGEGSLLLAVGLLPRPAGARCARAARRLGSAAVMFRSVSSVTCRLLRAVPALPPTRTAHPRDPSATPRLASNEDDQDFNRFGGAPPVPGRPNETAEVGYQPRHPSQASLGSRRAPRATAPGRALVPTSPLVARSGPGPARWLSPSPRRRW